MSTKKLLILTGVFLALLAFVVFFERHQPTSEEAAQAKRRLLDFKAEDVKEMVVERPDLPKVELLRAGGSWVLKGANGGAADKVTADSLAADLARLDVVGEVRSDFDPKEFGLDAPKAKVTLVLADGSSHTVLFGQPIPATDATAAAEGNRFGAVKFAPMATLAKPYDDFRSRNLVDVPASDITRVTVVRGPNKTVLVREAGDGTSPGPWRIEEPVEDFASRSFVDQLLADLTGSRVSEFPSVGPAEMSRIGLSPPAAEVTLQKGKEIVARLAFGAAKADAAGKIYARRDGLVVVVDDRVQESLGKELSAYRETRVLPVDPWNLLRMTFESEGLRTGFERVEGEWRSAGNAIPSSLAEDFVDKVGRTDVKRFLPRKEWAALGVTGVKKKPPVPAATLSVIAEGDKDPRDVKVYLSPALAAQKEVLLEVTGRTDGLLVDASFWDDVRALAAKVKTAATAVPKGKPTPVPSKEGAAGATAAPVPAGTPAAQPPRKKGP